MHATGFEPSGGRTCAPARAGSSRSWKTSLRFWSMCKGRSIADGPVNVFLFDEQVPPDAYEHRDDPPMQQCVC